jgi:hypothetical protein
MKRIGIVLLCIISLKSFGQSPCDDKTKQFLNSFFAKEMERGGLYYEAEMSSLLIGRVIGLLSYQGIDSNYWDSNNKRVIFTLSPEEKELVKNTLLAQVGKKWDSGVLDKATLHQKHRLPPNASREEKLKYIETYQHKLVVKFSNPVFLRNDSICLFFYTHNYEAMGGGGGGGELVIMKKSGDKWERYLLRTLFFG